MVELFAFKNENIKMFNFRDLLKYSTACFCYPWLLVTQSCPTLLPHELQPTALLGPQDSPGKNTGVRCHSLLQGIFPTQGSNPGLPHCRQILYQLSHKTLLGILSSYTKKIEILTLIRTFFQYILPRLEKCGMESCAQHTDSERREKTVYLYKETLEGNSLH